MATNRFYLFIIIRVILITLTCFGMVWFFIGPRLYATSFFFLVLLIIEMVALCNFLNRTNRDLTNFLIFLHENDTSITYSKGRIERYFKSLTSSLEKLTRNMQQTRLEKEQKHQYLQAVVEHIGIGLVAYSDTGKVDFMNRAARELFSIPEIGLLSTLQHRYPEVYTLLVTTNETSPVKFKSKSSELLLTIKRSYLKMNNSTITMVSFQNIKAEMDEQELQAWRKLIRVLRHEIMNSITPITTLTTALRRSFTNNNGTKPISELTHETIDDALLCSEVIEERSKGLVQFVEQFCNLTNAPKPILGNVTVAQLFDRVSTLFVREMHDKNILLKREITPSSLTLYVDEKLIEQVLINLIKNAVEALNGKSGTIGLQAGYDEKNTTFIRVTDTGCGITSDMIDSIFVPAFTTKEGGSGIGLSISKQLMQLHGGTIECRSEPNNGTCFELIFPKH